MDLETLKRKLHENNIPANLYSIDDGLKSMAYVLYKNYAKWECFYLDERGIRRGEQIFYNEEDAYDYLWFKMEYYLKNPPSIPPKSIFGR